MVNASGSYDYTYVKHEGQLVAQLNSDGSKYYVHGDHEGSTSVITDESRTVIENTTYSPFGEILTGGVTSRFDYEGKEFDSVVGDIDFNFRKYNPGWGLFLQPDTLIPNVYDPQSLNRYMFERGNPYGNKDPTGHIIPAIIAAAAVGAVLGAVSGAAIEAGIQYFVTGDIYSTDRIIEATITGAILGGAMGILGPGSTVFALKVTSEAIEGTQTGLDIYRAYKSAKEYKKMKESKDKDADNELKIKKDVYIDEKRNEIPIAVPGGAKEIKISSGKGKGSKAAPLYTKADGTVVWGTPPKPSPKPAINPKR